MARASPGRIGRIMPHGIGASNRGRVCPRRHDRFVKKALPFGRFWFILITAKGHIKHHIAVDGLGATRRLKTSERGHDARGYAAEWEVRAMPGIPEIIGESQVGTLDPVEEKPRSCNQVRAQGNGSFFGKASARSGMNSSPLRLRLHDFSGEGERAPP